MKLAHILLSLSIISFLLFCFITILVFFDFEFIVNLNKSINENIISDLFLVSFISFFGSPLFTLFLLFFVLILRKRKKEIYFSWVLFISAGTHFFIKKFLAFQRPENVILFTPGYPSGHSFYSALVYWSIAGLVWNKNKFAASILIIMPFIIGLTRLFLGVHWLTDVIGGLLFGAGWVFAYLYAIHYDQS